MILEMAYAIFDARKDAGEQMSSSFDPKWLKMLPHREGKTGGEEGVKDEGERRLLGFCFLV